MTNLSNIFAAEVKAPAFTIAQVWEMIEAGKKVYWGNTGYEVVAEDVFGSDYVVEFQIKHHTFKHGKVLSIRCMSNWFGGLMAESEMGDLFIQEVV